MLGIAANRELPADAVSAVPQYHLTHGVWLSQLVVGLKEIRTLYGSFATFFDGATIDGGNLRVPLVDIRASNGVLHVVDAVLLPPL